MELFTASDLKTLIGQNDYPCVSIYLPTHVTGRDIRQDVIRLKTLLHKCRDRLTAEGVKKVNDLLKFGLDLLDDHLFWQRQSHGLAVFLSPSHSTYFQLSFEPEQKLHIGHCFYVLPLVSFSLNDRTYYILVLRRKAIKLFEVHDSRLQEVDIPNVPVNIEAFLQYDISKEHIQIYTSPRGTSGGTDAMFYGQGDINFAQEIERYIKAVAKAIDKQLQGKTAPLVLAGVDYEQVIFRQNSSYRYLLQEGIYSELGKLDLKDLHRQAQPLVEAYFHREIEENLARYHNQINTPKASADVEEILPAAFAGRVDTLLVDPRQHVSGTYEPQSRHVDVHDTDQSGDEDLLNLAAVYSLRNDATVCPVTGDEVAEHKSLAAVFRY